MLLKRKHTHEMTALAFHPFEEYLCTGDITGRIVLWYGYQIQVCDYGRLALLARADPVIEYRRPLSLRSVSSQFFTGMRMPFRRCSLPMMGLICYQEDR